MSELSRRQLNRAAAGLALGAALGPARAQPLGPPRGEVILTVAGRIRHTNHREGARLSREMITALPQQRFTTQTPWYAAPRRFEGPLLRDLLARLGAQGTQVHAHALNDFQAVLPMSDADELDLLLAVAIDGQPIKVRDKGPLFLIYNFDALPSLRNETYYSRCVWQLDRLTVS